MSYKLNIIVGTFKISVYPELRQFSEGLFSDVENGTHEMAPTLMG